MYAYYKSNYKHQKLHERFKKNAHIFDINNYAEIIIIKCIRASYDINTIHAPNKTISYPFFCPKEASTA
jgi:hypothetical protein